MTSEKLTVLIFVAYYLPGFKSGGPVRSTANLVDHLGDEFDFKIITQDRDASDSEPYPNITINDWNKVGKAQVYYTPLKYLNGPGIYKLLKNTQYDILYLNSFFSLKFAFLPLFIKHFSRLHKTPIVLAPRGEFSKGALALKRLKKQFFISAFQTLRLNKNVAWQASSEHEKSDIREVFGSRSDIRIAPNLPPLPSASIQSNTGFKNETGHKNCIKIIFLSRISPKKNLVFALKALASVSATVHFSIYGFVDDVPYWQRCRKQIKKLPKNVHVKYHGAIPHEQVCNVLGEHDLFFLPTKGENYGHVIHEALNAGTPVLISDQTPWRNLEHKKIGWDLALEKPQDFVNCIKNLIAMSPEKRLELQQNAVLYAQIINDNESTVEANRELFYRAYNNH